MAFKEVIGHSEVVSFLQNTLRDNRVAHAYLFYGPAGVGKEFCAMQFATALLCEKPLDHGTVNCGKCSSCKRIEHQTHPNLIRIEQKESDTFLKIDTVREMRKEIGLKAFEGSRRVYLVPEADRMMPQAANALLKTLEEPSENVVLVLIATDLTTILPTIVSRCQLVRFYRLSRNLIKNQLIEQSNISESDAELYALLAEGSLGRALHLVQGEFLAARNEMLTILSDFNRAKPIQVFRTAEALLNIKLEFGELTDLLTLWFRDIFIYQRTQQKSSRDRLLMNPDYENSIAAAASVWSSQQIERAIDQLSAVNQLYRKLGAAKYGYGFGGWYSGMNQQLAIESVLFTLLQ